MRARPAQALVESMRSTSCDVTGQRHLVASATAREVTGGRHQMLPDSRGSRFLIDDDIFDDREGLQRMTKMRDDNHMTGPGDFARDLGDEDGVIAIAREAIECRREPRPRNSQAQVIPQMKLVVEFLQARQIRFSSTTDPGRGVVARGF